MVFTSDRVRNEIDLRLRLSKRTSHLKTDGSESLRASISSIWGPKALEDLVTIDEELILEGERSVTHFHHLHRLCKHSCRTTPSAPTQYGID